MTAFAIGVAQVVPVVAAPEGGTVVAGDVELVTKSARELNILQASRKAIVEWQSFSIGADESVIVQQPGVDALLLNRVTGSLGSEILGTLQANGRVLLVNPNGVFIGRDATIDVGGLVASTADLSDANFLADRYLFDIAGDPFASITNQGSISVADFGLVALVAPSVKNDGVISARLGRVSLAAGERFALDLYGDRLVNLLIDDARLEDKSPAGESATNAGVANSGQLLVDGGTVHISSAAAAGLVDQVINMTGYVQARTVGSEGGVVVIDGGEAGTVRVDGRINVAGTAGYGGAVDVTGVDIVVTGNASINADGGNPGDGGKVRLHARDSLDFAGRVDATGGTGGGEGGFVETSANTLTVRSSARVDTSAAAGNPGTWLLDPVDLSVVDTVTDAGEIAAASIEASLASNDVVLAAENSISVNAAIDSSAQAAATQLALVDENSDGKLAVNLNAVITLGPNQTLTGEGSTVNVSSAANIQNGVDVVAAGGTVNIAAGSYDLLGQQLYVDTADIALVGESEAGVLIDASAVPSSAGVLIHSDGVSIENLTIQGPTANTFGLKLRPLIDDPTASYTVRNVTVKGSGRTEIDILGVNGALLENVTADGQDTGGVGIAITDAHDIALENITTRDNQWGGIGIFSAGRFATGGTSGISLSGSNSLNESNLLYAENDVDSATGTFFSITGLDLEGFTYTVQNSTFRGNSGDPGDSEEFTFFQRSVDEAVAFALSLDNFRDSVVRENASGSRYTDTDGDVNLDADGDYHVGSSDTASMSIQAALDVVAAGGTVNVLAGTYPENLVMATPGVTLAGDSGALLQVGAGETGVSIRADDITVTSLSIDGPFTDHFTRIDWASAGNAFGMTVGANVSGASIVGNTITNTRTGVSFFAGSSAGASGNLIDNTKGSFLIRTNDVNLSDNAFGTAGNEWDIVFLNGVSDGAYATSPHIDVVAFGAAIMTLSSDNNGMRVLDRRYGSNGLLGSTPQFGNRSHVDVTESASFTAADDFDLGNGLGNERQPLAGINDALGAAVVGASLQVGAGSYAETVSVAAAVDLNFAAAGVTVDGLQVDSNAAVGLGGKLFANGEVVILGDAVLTDDVIVDTSSAGGMVNFSGSLDGTMDSTQDLTIHAGDGSVQFGDVGQTVGLGNVVITAADFDASGGTTSVASMSLTATGDANVGRSTLNSLFAIVLRARNILGRIISGGSVDLGASGDIDTQVVAQKAIKMVAANKVVAEISTPDDVDIDADSVDGTIQARGVAVRANRKVTLNVKADKAVNIVASDVAGEYSGDDIYVIAAAGVVATLNAVKTAEVDAATIDAMVTAASATVTASSSLSVVADVEEITVSSQGTANVNGDIKTVTVAIDSEPVIVNGITVGPGETVDATPEPPPPPAPEPEPEPEPLNSFYALVDGGSSILAPDGAVASPRSELPASAARSIDTTAPVSRVYEMGYRLEVQVDSDSTSSENSQSRYLQQWFTDFWGEAPDSGK